MQLYPTTFNLDHALASKCARSSDVRARQTRQLCPTRLLCVTVMLIQLVGMLAKPPSACLTMHGCTALAPWLIYVLCEVHLVLPSLLHAGRQQVQALAAAIPQLPDLRLLLLRNNGLKERDLQTIAAALLNPSCCMVCGLDLGFNQLGPDAPLLLLPVLHKPPQMMMQARRRSTCEAGDSEGSPNRSQNPSCAGAKTLPHVSSNSSGYSQGSSQSGVTAAASSSSGGGANWRGPVASSIEGGSRLQYTEQAGGFRLQQTQQQLLPPPSFGHAMLLQLVLCSNPIGDAGAEAVCRVVGTGDCMLQLLDLSGCGVTERLSGCLKGMLEGAR